MTPKSESTYTISTAANISITNTTWGVLSQCIQPLSSAPLKPAIQHLYNCHLHLPQQHQDVATPSLQPLTSITSAAGCTVTRAQNNFPTRWPAKFILARSPTVSGRSNCVVPENIHAPTTEGISCKVPPPPQNFHFLTTKITPPPPLWNFHYHFVHPHTLWTK